MRSLQNHAGYVVGWSGWVTGCVRQFAVQRHNTGVLSMLGLLWASAVAGFVCGRGEQKSKTRWAIICGSLVGSFACGFVVPLVALFLFAMARWLAAKPGRFTDEAALGHWILMAWFVGLSVATPLYHPYPRLLLPWVIVVIIGGAIGLRALTRGADPTPDKPELLVRVRPAPMAILGALTLLFVIAGRSLPLPAWEERTGLSRVAELIRAEIVEELASRPRSETGIDFVAYVVARPALYYHLAAHEPKHHAESAFESSEPSAQSRELRLPYDYITQPAPNLGMIHPGNTDDRTANFLIAGTLSATDAAEFETHSHRLKLIGRYDYSPSELVLLDEFPPSALSDHHREKIQLWEILPLPR